MMWVMVEKNHNLSMADLLAIIRAEIPELEIRSSTRIAEGLDHVVIDVNGAYIFRFSKPGWTPPVDELGALAMFRGKTSAEIPEVLFRGRSLDYMGYRKIPGVSLSDDAGARIPAFERKRLSQQIASFLFELHAAVDAGTAKCAGLEEYDESSFGEIYPVIEAKFPDDKRLIEFTRNVSVEFSQMTVGRAPKRVLHWDLHNGNMILNPVDYSLRGVVDFDTVRIADVHAEFRSLYRFNPTLAAESMEAYEKLTGVKLSFRRVKLYAWLVKLSDLAQSADSPASGMHINAMRRVQNWIRDEGA
jgi:aminoglycoside phosphotransferase (APT) family kinase protein